MNYIIKSSSTGEKYLSDGTYARGPLTTDQVSELMDASDAPDWVRQREGLVLR